MQLLANFTVVQKVLNIGVPTATVLIALIVPELFIVTRTLYHFVSFLFKYSCIPAQLYASKKWDKLKNLTKKKKKQKRKKEKTEQGQV